MKKLLLSASALVALSANAFAADLPSRVHAPSLSAPPVFTWTGLYVGASAGIVGVSEKLTFPGISNPNHQNGALLGGDVGYNWQTGALVFGVEADLAYSTVKGTSTSALTDPMLIHATKIDALGTIRGRVGFAVDRALFYVTGGLAYGDVVSSERTGSTAVTSVWRTGWTLGGGVEYAVMPNWTVRAEGLYVDLGSKSALDAGSITFKFKDTAVVARVGVNYKF